MLDSGGGVEGLNFFAQCELLDASTVVVLAPDIDAVPGEQKGQKEGEQHDRVAALDAEIPLHIHGILAGARGRKLCLVVVLRCPEEALPTQKWLLLKHNVAGTLL